jgi:hypothetical protein
MKQPAERRRNAGISALCALFFLSVAAAALGQSGSALPYQIPQTIYIGDAGRLVYPLDTLFFRLTNGIVPLDSIPKTEEISIHRIEIKDGSLIVDFQPFRTGTVRLPPLLIEDNVIDGLEVSVASLIEGKDAAVLSPAATPVNAPGTLWIIVGGSLGILGAAAAALFAALRGTRVFSKYKLRRRKRRAIRNAERTIKKIKTQMEKGTFPPAAALSAASVELRLFLEHYFEINCRSLVPVEFLSLNFSGAAMPGESYTPEYFAGFFTRCDTLRFSGKNIAAAAVNGLIGEVEAFIQSVHQRLA